MIMIDAKTDKTEFDENLADYETIGVSFANNNPYLNFKYLFLGETPYDYSYVMSSEDRKWISEDREGMATHYDDLEDWQSKPEHDYSDFSGRRDTVDKLSALASKLGMNVEIFKVCEGRRISLGITIFPKVEITETDREKILGGLRYLDRTLPARIEITDSTLDDFLK